MDSQIEREARFQFPFQRLIIETNAYSTATDTLTKTSQEIDRQTQEIEMRDR